MSEHPYVFYGSTVWHKVFDKAPTKLRPRDLERIHSRLSVVKQYLDDKATVTPTFMCFDIVEKASYLEFKVEFPDKHTYYKHILAYPKIKTDVINRIVTSHERLQELMLYPDKVTIIHFPEGTQ